MALTDELLARDGELGRWCARRFRGTGRVAAHLAGAAQGIHPVRPVQRDVPARHWAEIGGAWGQRLADMVQSAPPYAALLGMVRAGWATPTWVHGQAAQYASHRVLPEPQRRRALDLRPVADGAWVDLGRPSDDDGHDGPVSPGARALAHVLARSRLYRDAHAPVGTLGHRPVERALAVAMWLVAQCEEVYRSGHVNPVLAAALRPENAPTVGKLAALVDDDQATELVELGRRLRCSGVLRDLRGLAGAPVSGVALGIAAPTIVPHWADGDLLLGRVDRAGAVHGDTTLVEVKTVVSVRDVERVGRWIWQTLLYAWLDTTDMYRIRRVGVLLARHGRLVTWPTKSLAQQLLGPGVDVDDARREALALVTAAVRRDGGVFPVA